MADYSCPWLLRIQGCASRGTLRTLAPVDDLGLVDLVARVVGGRQAGGVADRAVDIADGTARPAYDVVVVIPDPRLVPRHGTRRLDAPYQPRVSQRSQHVIDGLQGHRHTEILTYDPAERSRIGVRTAVHRPQNRHPGPVTRSEARRSTRSKSAVADTLPTMAQILESIKNQPAAVGLAPQSTSSS